MRREENGERTKREIYFCLQRNWEKELVWMGFVLISSSNFKAALWKLFSASLPMFVVSKRNLSEVLLHLSMHTAAR